MGDRTGIAWTDSTWNPLRGCTRVSEGCRHCYAERVASRFSGPGLPYEGLARDGRWTGEVRLVEEHLADPLRWRKPRRIFVSSMSDLFHERVPDEWIDRIFAVMALSPQHTFQVLTKRPERMRAYVAHEETVYRVTETDEFRAAAHRVECDDDPDGSEAHHAATARLETGVSNGENWERGKPLPNVWLGVSVEDQATADVRVPMLLSTPAAVRFVSAEPLLGPVAWRPMEDFSDRGHGRAWLGAREYSTLDWIIVGGESGPGARPFDVAWARQTIEQTRAAGVACFVKQLGARPINVWPVPVVQQSAESMMRHGEYDPDEDDPARALRHRFGADPAEWPEDLRVREFPAALRERAR